jgi:hypothetical protein
MKQSALAGARHQPRPAPLLTPFNVDGAVACPHCGASAPWSSLASVRHVEGEALALHLAVPPDGWFVDVRACAACGVPFARKVRVKECARTA